MFVSTVLCICFFSCILYECKCLAHENIRYAVIFLEFLQATYGFEIGKIRAAYPKLGRIVLTVFFIHNQTKIA
mgnify:CR=1 FL=1